MFLRSDVKCQGHSEVDNLLCVTR